MIDDFIDDCDCQRLILLRTEYQELFAYNDYRIGIKEAIKTDPRTLISQKTSGLVISHEF
jgi:hypothetical protein